MWILGLLFMGLAASSFAGGDGSDDEGSATGFAQDTEGDEPPENKELVERDGDTGILIEGNSHAEQIQGTIGPDLLDGGAGNDTLQSLEGEDVLIGNLGDDDLRGGDGIDFLTGGPGDDLLNGGAGTDALLGDAGQDTLIGGDGDDWLSGADMTSRDLEVGDFHEDRDTATDLEFEEPSTPEEADVLFGGAGDDQLVLGEFDTATGGTGSDTFTIGHWVADNAPEITDFDPNEDVISIIVPENDPTPEITIARDLGETHVLANNVLMARITNEIDGFDASDVTFVEF